MKKYFFIFLLLICIVLSIGVITGCTNKQTDCIKSCVNTGRDDLFCSSACESMEYCEENNLNQSECRTDLYSRYYESYLSVFQDDDYIERNKDLINYLFIKKLEDNIKTNLSETK